MQTIYTGINKLEILPFEIADYSFYITIFQMQKCLSMVFVPVIRHLWPGMNESSKRSTAMVATMKKRAVQASRFMLQMLQAPLYGDKSGPTNEMDSSTNISADFESGEEGLAIVIGAEVIN